jgi:predicted nucleotidyltransferase
MDIAKREIVNIFRRYADRLKEKGINFQKIILFGSCAANKDKKDSDIDVAVISESFGKDHFEERTLLTSIAFYIDARIEPHPVNLKDFTEDNYQSIIHEIKFNGVEIEMFPAPNR